MNCTTHLLASGQSSLSEMEWFLVGLGRTEVFLIVCEYEFTKEESWHVLSYYPGMDWNKEQEIFGQINELLIEACTKDSDIKNINWNDNKIASEIYWNYKNNK